MRAGDLREARILIQRARELDSASRAHLIRSAAINYRLGNKDEAKSIILELLPSIPNWQENPPLGYGNRALIREILK